VLSTFTSSRQCPSAAVEFNRFLWLPGICCDIGCHELQGGPKNGTVYVETLNFFKY